MANDTPHTLFGNNPDEGQQLSCYKDIFGLDATQDGNQVSIADALAFFVQELGVPAIAAGQVVGDRVYEADHILTYGHNLFGDLARVDRSNADEPLIVSFLPDGGVTNISTSQPATFNRGLARVVVRGVTESVVWAGAFRLHAVFVRLPGFSRTHEVPGTPSETKMDLVVHHVAPVDEPQIVERDGNRLVLSFRVMTQHSRV